MVMEASALVKYTAEVESNGKGVWMMARYIDAELLEAEVFTPHIYDINRDDVIALIAEQPIADVVEVVRCKDCKRCYEKRTKRNNQLMRFCMRMDGNEYQVNANDFCSYGERRDT